MRRDNMKRRILGIWDLNASTFRLGDLLIYAHELMIKSIQENADFIDVGIIGEKNKVNPTYLAVLSGLKGIDRILFRIIKKKDSIITGPEKAGSTLFIQKFFEEKGYTPYLSCKNNLSKWANSFFQKYLPNKKPVVVHLKNTGKGKNNSNADFREWYKFFRKCSKVKDVVFVLIGNEEIDKRIVKLPNIIISNKLGSSLIRDLALIEKSSFFMGTASGPANMAILGKVPYIIFKDPDHHKKEMMLELRNSDSFPFARPFQKILRVRQDTKRIVSEFDSLYSHVSIDT